MILGKVDHSDCTDIMITGSISNDFTFMAKQDGILRVTSEVVLHEGHRDFSIYSLGSEAQWIITLARVVYDGHNHNMTTEVDATKEPDTGYPQVPILDFPKSNGGLKRRKRHWAMPPISVSENQRGPYPMHLVQIRSNVDKSKTIHYSITGPGADQPPNNLFTMDRETGNLYVTQKLDREEQAEYKLVVHTVAEGSSGNAEDPMEIIIRVIDQNDNKPVFNQTTYEAEVPEASPKGFEVIQVEATDADEPDNDNSAIRYRIMSEEPQGPSPSVFAIDPVTGVITVNAEALDRGKHPQYTLLVEAADFAGEGLAAQAKVLITVSANDDNPPVISQPADAVNPEAPVLLFPQSSGGLKRRKRDWVIPPLSVPENHGGPYPFKINQIRSSEDSIKTIHYSITGPGADQPPIDLFTMDRETGNLYVTQELDREKQAEYKIWAHAVAKGSSGNAEDPMEMIIKVIDQNDNRPIFNQTTYMAEVPENSPRGFDVIQVFATDADEPNNDNSDIRYGIMEQVPEEPSPDMFTINSVTGAIRVNAAKLDREMYPEYTLKVSATDQKGKYHTGIGKVIIKVTDSNDHAPVFTEASYTATVDENKVDAEVVRMLVTDGDEPRSSAWNAKFTIVDGDPGNLFTVKTGSNKQEGIITTAKGLDFEKISKHTLLVEVLNEIPFAIQLPTYTATVEVTVNDVNEAPIFKPKDPTVTKSESLKEGTNVVKLIAEDPDTARKQKVMFKMYIDPAGWLEVSDEGLVTVRSKMDRESAFVSEGKYMAVIHAYDDDQVPATGTGTLTIILEDVNDNAPSIEQREFRVCNKKPPPQILNVTDKDGPGNTSPYRVILHDTAKVNWTAKMDDTKTAIVLSLIRELEEGEYSVRMTVTDTGNQYQESTVKAHVCECTGEEVMCKGRAAAGSNLPVILGILGGILLLLMLVLLLLLFARRKKPEKEPLLLQDDDIRDNIYYYDEEGGGEDDQDFDLGVLHRGLDNRPEVFRNDVAPMFMTAPVYKPRPANPDDIGNFIGDNLKAADNDPTAPPYDSLLVFDYEGGGSEAGSLSSLNSSSDGDQDYDCLADWGPRFKKLADMYGGGDDDML
uniref:Cadherin-1 n=1 Tax=Cyprinodon variegatus TaxID=28743 RepID=A0A3Q2DS46_CYPVA